MDNSLRNHFIALAVIFGGIFILYMMGHNSYKTVDEYYQAMQKVQQRNEYYTLEIEQNEQPKNRSLLTKVYVKGNLFRGTILEQNRVKEKTEMYLVNNKMVFMNEGDKYAVVNPVYDMIDWIAAKNTDIPVETIKQFMTNIANPSYILFKWNEPFAEEIEALLAKVEEKYKLVGNFVDNHSQKNGFRCRLIQYTEDDYTNEVCVSDTYGIAVYYKISSPDKSMEWNVKSIDTKKFDESVFALPSGTKVYTFTEIMRSAFSSQFSNGYRR